MSMVSKLIISRRTSRLMKNTRSLWLLGFMSCALFSQGQTPLYYYVEDMKVEVHQADNAVVIQPKDEITSGALTSEFRQLGIKTEAVRNTYLKVDVAPTAAVKTLTSRSKIAAGEKLRPRAIIYDGAYREKLSDDSAMVLNPRLSVKLKSGEDIDNLCKTYGLKVVQKFSFIENGYLLECLDQDDLLKSLKIANKLQESGLVEWASPELEKKRAVKMVPNDPLYGSQWHLKNLGTNTLKGIAGNDINIEPAWNTVQGAGVNIVVVDDGVDIAHPDLAPNVLPNDGWDFADGDVNPSPVMGDNHGTACAGLAAARGNNGIGVSGSAPLASLMGVRLNFNTSTDAIEASAVDWRVDDIGVALADVSSNSWGPIDSGTALSSPGPVTLNALQSGAVHGRGGKGVVYLWAGGNGGNNDNINRDGYANSPYVIPVAPTLSDGKRAPYSEKGAALLINTPGGGDSGSDDLIVTTDRTGGAGYTSTDYVTFFNGSSAATPIAAGVAALIIDANPNLTYRDVKQIFAKTATVNDPTYSDWKTNGAGHKFSHTYGFGRVNAANAVAAATSWTNLPPLAPPIVQTQDPGIAIPDNNPAGIQRVLSVAGPVGFKIEYVEVQVNISHSYRGDLEIKLTSPSGMESRLHESNFSDSNSNISFWKYRSNAHLDESPDGNWTFTVADKGAADYGMLHSVSLRIYGHISGSAAVDNWDIYE